MLLIQKNKLYLKIGYNLTFLLQKPRMGVLGLWIPCWSQLVSLCLLESLLQKVLALLNQVVRELRDRQLQENAVPHTHL